MKNTLPNKLIVLLQPVCDDKSINLFMNKLIKDEKLGNFRRTGSSSTMLTLQCEGEDFWLILFRQKRPEAVYKKKIYVPQMYKKTFSKSNKQYTTSTHNTLFENASNFSILFFNFGIFHQFLSYQN